MVLFPRKSGDSYSSRLLSKLSFTAPLIASASEYKFIIGIPVTVSALSVPPKTQLSARDYGRFPEWVSGLDCWKEVKVWEGVDLFPEPGRLPELFPESGRGPFLENVCLKVGLIPVSWIELLLPLWPEPDRLEDLRSSCLEAGREWILGRLMRFSGEGNSNSVR